MTIDKEKYPNIDGFFGEYGGKFVPETLMYALEELEQTYAKLKDEKAFKEEFYADLLREIAAVPQGDELLVLGDFNARVGNNATEGGRVWPREVLGNFGLD